MARGPGPTDERLFAADALPALRTAVAELAWLLSRGYAEKSALELVGDRHQLRARQRKAVLRCSCSDAQLRERSQRRICAIGGGELREGALAIDGFNVIIAVESALAGGVILRGRDGMLRDMASVHGSYRRSDHTARASDAIADAIEALAPRSVLWLLDRPVSNSGRLKAALAELAESRGLEWQVELDYDPDRRLASFAGIVASGDGWILDQAVAHVDLAALAIARIHPDPWLVDLGHHAVDRAQRWG